MQLLGSFNILDGVDMPLETDYYSKFDIDAWLTSLRTAWLTKDLSLVAELFGHCNEYFESSFHAPATTVSEIVDLWREVEDHRDVTLEFKVLALCRGRAVVNYDAKYLSATGPRHSNGIYYIEFEEALGCTIFRQWSEAC